MPITLFDAPAAAPQSTTGMSDADVFGASQAPAPKPAAAPAGMSDADVFAPQPSAMQRIGSNIEDAFGHTITGALANLFDASIQHDVEQRLKEQGLGANADAYQRGIDAQAAEQAAKEKATPAWNAPGTSLGDKLVRGGEALAGQLVGAAASPEGLITDVPGVGKVVDKVAAPITEKVLPKAVAPAVVRAAEAGGSQAVVQGVTDPAVQAANIAAGKQQKFDPVQAALAPVFGVVLGATVHGAGEGLPALADAFKSWRLNRAAADGTKPPAADAAPTQDEMKEFATSPEMAAAMKANGITDPNDPRVAKLDEALGLRRQQEAERVVVTPQDAGGSTPAEFKADQARLDQEKQDVQAGILHPAQASTAGRVARPELPQSMPVNANGQADAGDLAIKAALDMNTGQRGLPVPTEPQPARMTPEEVAQSQAKMTGGNANTAEPPPRLIAPENRLPQTPEQAQGQHQAGQAFQAAEAQRARAGASVRDTQPAGRPEGADQGPVVMDEGFPVQVLSRQMKDVGGKTVETATVHRYDPRTGKLDPEGMPYDVPVRQLTTKNYAVEPRMAQDFEARAEGPGNPEQPRMANQGVKREPDQTYRTTARDPNEDFPGATRPGPEEASPPEGRSPLPEQPEGPGPFRARPSSEEEAINDFARRQRMGEEDFARAKRNSEGPRKGDTKTSSKAADVGADGRYAIDDRGFVNSDKGGPIKFAEQRQAAKWIINEGNKKSVDQIFEIENHPSGSGFTVRERGRAETPNSGVAGAGGNGARGSETASPGGVPARAASPELNSAREDVAAYREANTKKPKTENVFDAIKRLGGIKDAGGDVKQIMQDYRPGMKGESYKKGVINPDGKSPDQMRRLLQDEGWFRGREGNGDDTSDLYDLMDKQARGEDVRHPDDMKSNEEAAYDTQRMRQEEMDRAGVTDKDTNEQAAEKLADYRRQQEADFQSAQDALDSHLEGLSDADRQILEDAGYEPGADVGEEEAGEGSQEPRGAQDRESQPSDVPGWEDDIGGRDSDAGASERAAGEHASSTAREGSRGRVEQSRVPGTEHEASASDLRERAARRNAEEHMANPRAYNDRAQKPANDGLFADKSEENQKDFFEGEEKGSASDLGRTFYSNAIADPQVWKSVWRGMGRTLARIFHWEGDEASAWARHLENMRDAMPAKDARTGEGALSHVGHMLKVLGYSNDGVMRSLAAKWKSNTIKNIADMFHAEVGLRKGAVGKDYFQSMHDASSRWMNRVEDLMKPFDKMKLADRRGAMDQIGRLIVNPGKIKPGTPIHDAAAGIAKMLKEIHGYMREAGVQVGEVKNGYLPRVEDIGKVMADPSGFKAAAKRAYLADGVPAKDAEKAAEDWLNRLMLGDVGVRSDGNDFLNAGGGATSNVAGRTLSKKADDILGDFYLRNPSDILPAYINRSVRKAEWSRRFGVRDEGAPVPRGEDAEAWRSDPLGKWKDMKAAMNKEGASAAIPEVVDIIKSNTGNMGAPMSAGKRKAMSFTRTWSVFTYLPRVTFTSLAEPVSIAIRTGSAMDLMRAYGLTVKNWVPKLRDDQLRNYGRDLGFVGDAIDQLAVSQTVGGEDGTRLGRQLQSTFFRHIGMTQFMEAKRLASMQIGQTFIRRLASDVLDGNKESGISHDLLTELGVGSNGKSVNDFAKWVMSQDTRPSVDTILEGGDHGQTYHTALGRFLSQSVMHPTAAMKPRYANHPLGSLIFSLQSYNYAFQKQVMNRVGSMAKDALNPKSGLSAGDRMKYLAPLGMLPMLFGIQYGLNEIRSKVFADPDREGQPEPDFWEKAMTATSRSGMLGMADNIINAVGQYKYNRDPTATLAGPIFGGGALEFVGDAIKAAQAHRGDGDTTTVDRKFAKDVYDFVVKPTLIAGSSYIAPGGTMLGLGLGAGSVFASQDPGTRSQFERATAGEAPPPKGAAAAGGFSPSDFAAGGGFNASDFKN